MKIIIVPTQLPVAPPNLISILIVIFTKWMILFSIHHVKIPYLLKKISDRHLKFYQKAQNINLEFSLF